MNIGAIDLTLEGGRIEARIATPDGHCAAYSEDLELVVHMRGAGSRDEAVIAAANLAISNACWLLKEAGCE